MNILHVSKDGKNIPVMVFRKDSDTRISYQIGLSRRTADGSWQNGYIMAQFNKDVELQNKEKIVLDNAILDFYVNTENRTVPFIRVFEFSKIENENTDGDFITVDDEEDLPF